MFGVSFSEVILIAIVALVFVGPKRLPEILGTLGQWIGRVRRMTTEVRRQTGIDEILRTEGVAGGLAELRSMMRGDFVGLHRLGSIGTEGMSNPSNAVIDAYGEAIEFDRFREYPSEGPDSYGAIPEDLVANAAPVLEPPKPVMPFSSPSPESAPAISPDGSVSKASE